MNIIAQHYQAKVNDHLISIKMIGNSSITHDQTQRTMYHKQPKDEIVFEKQQQRHQNALSLEA